MTPPSYYQEDNVGFTPAIDDASKEKESSQDNEPSKEDESTEESTDQPVIEAKDEESNFGGNFLRRCLQCLLQIVLGRDFYLQS